jgi:acetoin utilization protein AcuB
MNVADIMTHKPATVRLNTSLREVLELMEETGCHHVPVLNGERQVIGIISDRDCRTALNSPYIMRERWQDETLVNTLEARTFMTPAPIVIAPEASAVHAAQLMLQNHISCLPVMRDETLVGILTRSDLIMAFMQLASDGHSVDQDIHCVE